MRDLVIDNSLKDANLNNELCCRFYTNRLLKRGTNKTFINL